MSRGNGGFGMPADARTGMLFGYLGGDIEIVGDIVAPIVPPRLRGLGSVS